MPNWDKQAFLHIGIGYQICLMATLFNNGDRVNEGLFIASFIFYTAALVLAAVDKLKSPCSKMMIGLPIVILLSLSAILTLASVIYWGQGVRGGMTSFHGTLNIIASILGVLGVVFTVLKMVNGNKTSPSTASIK